MNRVFSQGNYSPYTVGVMKVVYPEHSAHIISGWEVQKVTEFIDVNISIIIEVYHTEPLQLF